MHSASVNEAFAKSSEPQERTLEVKIRPYPNQSQERPDQDGATRVMLSMNALLDLGLSSGQICYLWKNGETRDARREAIAWLSTEKNLNKKVAQISKAFQEVCGYKLGDDLIIAPGNGEEPKAAQNVSFKDVSVGVGDIEELSEEDRPHWEWHLKKSLGLSKMQHTDSNLTNTT